MIMQDNLPNFTNTINDSLEMNMASDADSIGKTLAKARLIHNLEQREVAARLNIDLSVIQAIERDDFKALGASVFVRNYLKRYAQLIRIPEDRILEQYKQLGYDELPPLKVTRSIKPQTKTSDIRWLSYPLIVALVGWLGWIGLEKVSVHFDSADNADLADINADSNNSLLSLPEQEQALVVENTDSAASRLPVPQPPTPVASPSAISPAVAQSENNSIAATSSAAAGSQKITPDNQDLDQETTSLVAIATDLDSESAGDDSGGDEIADVIDGESQLVLEFSDDCWVEIKDADGKRLAYGVIKANSVSNLSGPAPFSVTLGNAGAAIITLNGNTIDKSVYIPKHGSVSRFTLELPQG